MPIKFRCPTCMGLLSIARRKAATTIGCPKCGEAVIVPDLPPEPGSADSVAIQAEQPTAGGGAAVVAPSAPKLRVVKNRHDPKLFEKDIDQLLDKFIPPPPAPVETLARSPEPESVVARRTKRDDGVMVSKVTAAVLGVLALVLLAVAFATGFFIGRSGGGG
jgi:hypothetical protein